MLDFIAQYEAFQRRDLAFDGVVFVAVKTTGIYCLSSGLPGADPTRAERRVLSERGGGRTRRLPPLSAMPP